MIDLVEVLKEIGKGMVLGTIAIITYETVKWLNKKT